MYSEAACLYHMRVGRGNEFRSIPLWKCKQVNGKRGVCPSLLSIYLEIDYHTQIYLLYINKYISINTSTNRFQHW